MLAAAGLKFILPGITLRASDQNHCRIKLDPREYEAPHLRGFLLITLEERSHLCVSEECLFAETAKRMNFCKER